MSYELFQSIIVFMIVAFSTVQLLRKLMPATMRKLEHRLLPHRANKAVVTKSASGCSDCSRCNACGGLANLK